MAGADLPAGRRIADDEIYQPRDEAETPKQYFVRVGDLIAAAGGAAPRVLDVGCAAGAFLAYLHARFPRWRLAGLDQSPKLIEAARARGPADIEFAVGNVEDGRAAEAGGYDVVTIFGVLNCLDDPEAALRNLARWTRPGGRIIVFDMFNPDPVDVLVRHRRSAEDEGAWELGWNTWSFETIGRVVDRIGEVRSWSREEFVPGFDLPKREDVVRTWTISSGGKPRQLTNGLGQLVNLYYVSLERS